MQASRAEYVHMRDNSKRCLACICADIARFPFKGETALTEEQRVVTACALMKGQHNKAPLGIDLFPTVEKEGGHRVVNT